MKQKYKVAILGCGTRGLCYAELMAKKPEEFELVAICDTNPEQLKKMQARLDLKNAKIFDSPTRFLEEKYADILVIATPDYDHIPQAVAALNLGYHLLLEKPISCKREELQLLLDTQEKTGKQVVVCHELRYGAAFQKCEEILQSGTIGTLAVIDALERPFYWHWAQAYVRGIGASIDLGYPAILAKCSHDLDLIQNYAQSECDTVSSVGELRFFKPENAPEGAAERCLDCKHIDTCPYSAKRIYIDQWHEAGEPTYTWPYNKVAIQSPLTEENLYDGLRNGVYGRCAFGCKVDMVDHQLVQMTFKNGVKASLKMVFGAEGGRRITFYGTHGELIMDERDETIVIMPFGKEKEVIEMSTILEGGNGHGGGDAKLIDALYGMISGEQSQVTGLKNSIECHLMGIAAEESRARGGAVVQVHQ